MDESTKIHPDATPVFEKKEGGKQIGWVYTLDRHFDFTAVQEEDCISVYVLWGDDQPGDMYSSDSWDEIRRELQTLIKAAQL
jgi:hypothetical protein